MIVFRTVIISFALIAAGPLLARQPDKAIVSSIVIKFFDAISAKNYVAVEKVTWPGSCYDVGEGKCQKLDEIPFGRTIGHWVVNDMKVNIVGQKAAVSLHSTQYAYGIERETTKERAVCLRSLEAERRGGIWKLSRMSNVRCFHYDKEGRYQP